MITYHITERTNLPSILKSGFKVHLTEAYEHEGVKAIFLTLRKPTTENMLGWEDLLDPVIVIINLPAHFPTYDDEAGMKVYPEVEPIYTTRNIPAKYIQEVIEVEKLR